MLIHFDCPLVVILVSLFSIFFVCLFRTQSHLLSVLYRKYEYKLKFGYKKKKQQKYETAQCWNWAIAFCRVYERFTSVTKLLKIFPVLWFRILHNSNPRKFNWKQKFFSLFLDNVKCTAKWLTYSPALPRLILDQAPDFPDSWHWDPANTT